MKIFTLFKLLKNAYLANDEWSRFFLAEKIFNSVYKKMKIQEYGNIMFEDRDFCDYYEHMVGYNYHSFDRKYNLNNLMNLVDHLDGKLAECGVFEGATAYLIAKRFPHDKLYLFDTFGGLSIPNNEIDGNYWKEGDLCAELEKVQKNLSDFPNIEYKQGNIPKRFEDVSHSKFKFLHIDVDLYQPTLDSVAFFYNRMVKGGVIICDDYGFRSCPGAKKAFDEFFVDKHESIIQLSSGQAFIIKQ